MRGFDLPMKKKIIIGIASLAIAVTPLIQGNTRVEAATTASKITAVNQVVKPVYLSAKSYINLVDVTIAPSEEGQVASFTLSIYNGGSSEIKLVDYWFRLASQSGTSYPLKVVSEDAKKNTIAPNSKSYITLYAKVGEKTKLSDLVFKIVKFDFNVSNYEKSIGKFTFPKNYTNEVTATSFKTLYFSNSTVYSKVAASSLSSSGDDHFVTVNFVYNNAGKRAATISKYKYYIVTADGIFYEAQPAVTGDITLQPLTRQELQLTATIPSSIKTKGWKLVVMKESGGDTVTLIPAGAYQLNLAGGVVSGGTVSDTFKYVTTKGTYQFTLNQLVRQPWETQDILSARIRIKNTSLTDSAVIPNVTGYFYLDNQVKLDFKTVATNNSFGLNSNGYIDVDVYAKLPADYKFSTVKIVVNEKKDEQVTTKAGELSSSSYLSEMPIYTFDKVYKITRDGSSMNATLNSVNVYDNVTTKLVKVQMTLSSIESRTIDPIKMTAVFINDNGDIFPAQTNMAEGKVNASNKALVNITATVPQNYSTANLRLIVGEGVADTKYASGTITPDAYVGAVKYNLPQEQRLMTVMKDIPLLPFKLTINKFTPQVFGDGLELILDYNLVKDLSYNVYPTDRKIIMAIEGDDLNDGTTYVYYSQEIGFEGDAATALQPGANKITLKKNMNYETINGNLKFKAKIYEVVNGSKKLIAEHPFYWFIENDWTKDVVSSNQ
jgi:hypothetical protein